MSSNLITSLWSSNFEDTMKHLINDPINESEDFMYELEYALTKVKFFHKDAVEFTKVFFEKFPKIAEFWYYFDRGQYYQIKDIKEMEIVRPDAMLFGAISGDNRDLIIHLILNYNFEKSDNFMQWLKNACYLNANEQDTEKIIEMYFPNIIDW